MKEILDENGNVLEYAPEWGEEIEATKKWCRYFRDEYVTKIIQSYRGSGMERPSRKHLLRVLPRPIDFSGLKEDDWAAFNDLIRQWKHSVHVKAAELTFCPPVDDEPVTKADEEEDRLDPEEFPEPEFAGVEKGDVYSLNEAISAWEEEIAEWEGHKPWAAYYTYYVPARCESGLRLCVEADDDDGPWTLDDGGAHEEYADWDDLIGAAEDWYDYLREEAADGRLTKYNRRME